MRWLYIPENLCLEDIVPNELQSDFHLDYFHYLISLIYEQRVFYKNKDEFTPIKAEYLRKIIRNYKVYKDLLLEKKIIGCDNFYIKTEKSLGFKLLPPYCEVKHKKINIKSYKLKKKLNQWKRERLPKTKVHKHLYKCLECLRINYDAAKEEIDGYGIEQFNANKISIDKFLDKEFFLYSDGYGRIHSNVTTLKSTLRKYLLFKKQKLINIDIANSQPLLLLNIPPIYTIRCTLTPNSFNDLKLYMKLVQQGSLYDFIMQSTGISNRKAVKESFFREVLYGRRVSSFFCDTFPTIANILKGLKKENYKRLSWIMQRAESKLIIGKICFRAMQECPDAFISTIHDSLLTTPEYVDKIKQIILEEFSKMELEPKLVFEIY